MNTGKVKSGNRRRQVSKSTYYTLGDKTNGCSFMITAAPTYEECMIKAKEQIEKNKNGPYPIDTANMHILMKTKTVYTYGSYDDQLKVRG